MIWYYYGKDPDWCHFHGLPEHHCGWFSFDFSVPYLGDDPAANVVLASHDAHVINSSVVATILRALWDTATSSWVRAEFVRGAP